MRFNSLEFVVFLTVVFTAMWALTPVPMVQTIFLIAASYFFYANLCPWFPALLFFTSMVDYGLGGKIHRTPEPGRRKLWLILSISSDLGLLAFFKYFNFFAVQTAAALNALGLGVDPILLQLAFPVGVSFFTFQSMSYTIDIYRRRVEPAGSFLEYLAYLAFFPRLLVGPIVRAADFLPQLRVPRSLTRAQGGLGLILIMTGLVKKVCVADYLKVNLVDRVFDTPTWYSSAEVLVGVYAYALQIYCDFSGYTDVAIGAGLLLGFQIPENFRAPYAAINLRDFWRRWHITLSTWLRDYLYIPLGGSRQGPARTYVALVITMLLGGFWHGAAWTFVIWGALHGGALAATRLFQRIRGERKGEPSWPLRVVLVVGTFHFVCLAWIFFRAKSFGSAWAVIARIAELRPGLGRIAPSIAVVLIAALALHYFPRRWTDRAHGLFSRLPAPVQGLAMVAVGVLVYLVAQSDYVPYIYEAH